MNRLPDFILRLVSLTFVVLCLLSLARSMYEAARVAPQATGWLVLALASGIALVLVELARATPDPHDPKNDRHDRNPR